LSGSSRRRAPERGTRDPRSGIGQRRGCDDRGYELVGRTSRCGVASSCGRNCSALRGRARFYRNSYGTGLCGRSALSGSSRRRAPEHGTRGPRSGIGQRRGCGDRGYGIDGATSRYGVTSSYGRNCSTLRGRAIRFVAFRASHPAKPSSRPR
jgi:hypothetical protein